jgi:ribonuclease HI
MATALPEVEIYTDGGCRPNPGAGGWGAVLVSGGTVKEISGGQRATTNNQMELTAAIEALRALKRPCRVRLHTDSQYLRNGITSWMAKWKRNGWRSATGEAVKNQDLWQELERMCATHEIEWKWVRGHAGDALNERCHELAAAQIAVVEAQR